MSVSRVSPRAEQRKNRAACPLSSSVPPVQVADVERRALFGFANSRARAVAGGVPLAFPVGRVLQRMTLDALCSIAISREQGCCAWCCDSLPGCRCRLQRRCFRGCVLRAPSRLLFRRAGRWKGCQARTDDGADLSRPGTFDRQRKRDAWRPRVRRPGCGGLLHGSREPRMSTAAALPGVPRDGNTREDDGAGW